MNARRVAALLRELADELERDDAPAPANDAPAPKRRRAPLPPPVPAREPTEIDRERAKQGLRRLGYRVRP